MGFFFKKKEPPKASKHYSEIDFIDGGTHKTTELHPIKDIDGRICELNYHEIDYGFSGSFSLNNKYMTMSFKTDEGEETASRELTSDEIKALDRVIKESGVNALNGWYHHTDGIPAEGECTISANFTSGEMLYISFNGHNAPEGFETIKPILIECFKSFK